MTVRLFSDWLAADASGNTRTRQVALALVLCAAVTAAGIAYAELTGAREAVRPFLITSVVIGAWIGRVPGGVLAAVVSVFLVLVYSSESSVTSMSSEELWFLLAFAIAAVCINLLSLSRAQVEQRLIETTAALRKEADAHQESMHKAEASEFMYHNLADAMPQLVWAASNDGKVDYYNARAQEYEGLVQSSDRSWDWQPVIHPDDVEATWAAWERATSERTPYQAEHRMRMNDGTYRWHVSRALPVTDARDGSTQWIGTATDIEDLRKALAAKDEFLGLVSHDLRSPLTVVIGNASMLKRGLFESEEEAMQAVADIETRARELARTVEELIELAQMQAGQQAELEPVLVPTVVEQICGDLRTDVAPRLEWRFEGDDLLAEADPRYVRRIVQNLVINASKYGDSNSPIEVAVSEAEGWVQVSVLDRGAGIAPGSAEMLFEPFYRAEGAVERNKHGLGIGLTLCKRLVEVQGGSIGARPREGGGAEFWFRLKATDLPG